MKLAYLLMCYRYIEWLRVLLESGTIQIETVQGYNDDKGAVECR